MKKLKIDILCNDGSPLGVELRDIHGESGRVGVGGAELALLTLCEAWHNEGHTVRLYNNPRTGTGSPFAQYPIDTFLPKDDRDILIIFRSPNHRSYNANGKKVWWSCDQYTVGSFADFSKTVDAIVTISPFHAEHFKGAYGIEDTVTIDLPVRIPEYPNLPKVKHSMIFCSVPDRGLMQMAQAFPEIKRRVPDASLVVTSDYRLWGVHEPRNERFIRHFLGMDGVRYLGAVTRKELVVEQAKAEVHSYPCTYNELFCIAVAECQAAGAYPVTSTAGALPSTNMGLLVEGSPLNGHWISSFIDAVTHVLENPSLPEMQDEVRESAIKRFNLKEILKKWNKVFYE